MKYSYVLLLIMTNWIVAFGQAPVVFQTLPRDLQLFQRDVSNQAVALIEGSVTDASATRLTLQVDRAGKLIHTQQVVLTNSRNFRFEPVIRAELAEYSLRVYLHRATGDSSLVADRRRLLCGDLFLIYGQSNAFGLEDLEKITVSDQFMRQCGYVYNATDIPAAMQWYPALQPYGAVGAVGLYLGEAINKTARIPVGFINGAEGGANINQLSDRNAGNPADLKTFYGRMLYRAQWAGVHKQLKAIIFKQGEAEAGSSTANYATNFDRLYRFFREDYGNVPRLYASQINVLSGGSSEAGTLRDFQRRLPFIYPQGVSSIATIGTVGYDGLHYNLTGSQQIGYEQARQLLRDLYASGASAQVDSPNVRQVFQNNRNDTLTVVFEPEMAMRWAADTTLTRNGQTRTRQLIDLFLADGKTGLFAAGRAEANRVYLTLKQPAPLQTLSYFPPYYGEAPTGFYVGPTLKNQLGMRAFTFDRHLVARALSATANLTIAQTTRQAITLSWAASAAGATAILLERSVDDRASFTQLARLPIATSTYTDTPVGNSSGLYAYRIRLAGDLAESTVSNVVVGRLADPCSLSATVVGNPVVPYGGTLQLTAVVSGTSIGSPVTYLWRGPGGIATAASEVRQQSLTPGLSGMYSVTITQGSCSAVASVSVTVQQPLAMEPAASVRIWPNPVRSGQRVRIQIPGVSVGEAIWIQLTNAAGKRVYGQVSYGQVASAVIELPSLLPGVYIVDLTPAVAGRQTCRLLVE